MQNVYLYLFKLYNGLQEFNGAWYLLFYIPFMYYTIIVGMKIKYLYIEIRWKKSSGVYLTFSYRISCFDEKCPHIVPAHLQKKNLGKEGHIDTQSEVQI